MYKVGLLGTGFVGAKRAEVISRSRRSELSVVFDPQRDWADRVAAATGAVVARSWEEVVEDPGLEIIVVSTTHESLAPLSAAALNAGKHVLCEKPVGRNPDEVHAASITIVHPYSKEKMTFTTKEKWTPEFGQLG